MPRNIELPGADELFRPTNSRTELDPQASATKRVRHDEKITVYISSEELMAVEQARLKLKAEFGIRADRGRLIREAAALAIAELDTVGADCALIKRLKKD